MNRLRTLLVCLPVLVLLTGCTAQETASQVADLPATGGAAGTGGSSAPISPSADRRPQLQLDTPDSEVARLVNAWRQCLLDHGARRPSANEPAASASDHEVGILVHQPVPAAATAACAGIEPQYPRELAASTNPRFHEQSTQWITCMQRRGLWYTLSNDRDLTATYTPGHAIPDDTGAIEEDCTMQVFGGRR